MDRYHAALNRIRAALHYESFNLPLHDTTDDSKRYLKDFTLDRKYLAKIFTMNDTIHILEGEIGESFLPPYCPQHWPRVSSQQIHPLVAILIPQDNEEFSQVNELLLRYIQLVKLLRVRPRYIIGTDEWKQEKHTMAKVLSESGLEYKQLFLQYSKAGQDRYTNYMHLLCDGHIPEETLRFGLVSQFSNDGGEKRQADYSQFYYGTQRGGRGHTHSDPLGRFCGRCIFHAVPNFWETFGAAYETKWAHQFRSRAFSDEQRAKAIESRRAKAAANRAHAEDQSQFQLP